MEAAIDGINEWVQPHINDGVYRCGFAVKQEAYEKAFGCAYTPLLVCALSQSRIPVMHDHSSQTAPNVSHASARSR